jgi:lysophospholipid acyltransferase (LPLAT)-like uncharacterized protein
MNILSGPIRSALAGIIWWMVRGLSSTYRFEYKDLSNLEAAQSLHPKGAYLFALWHEHALSIMAAHAWKRPYLALASRSKDGDYAAHIAKKFGFTPVRGSSRKKNKDKGGKEAMLEFIHQVGHGFCGGITIDGPKGPRHECKPGIVIIAKETGAPVLPVIASPASYWEINSWDKFKIPKPFSKIIIQYLPPLTIAKNSDEEEIKNSCDKIRDSLCSVN